MIPNGLCEGLGLRACETCARNVDNYTAEQRTNRRLIHPAASPPKCADWMPIQSRTGSEV